MFCAWGWTLILLALMVAGITGTEYHLSQMASLFFRILFWSNLKVTMKFQVSFEIISPKVFESKLSTFENIWKNYGTVTRHS
jgi:hypothetical protein